MILLPGGRRLFEPRLVCCLALGIGVCLAVSPALAAPPSPGGDITATAPGGGATTITEDDPAPGAANVRFTPTTLSDADMGETPDSIRLVSITGGTIAQGDGSAITVSTSGTVLALTAGGFDARFTPDPDRDTAATIQYRVVDEGGGADSTSSTITIDISPADDDAPDAGGNVTATNTGGGLISISEDAAAPVAANIRVTPATLSDPDTVDDPPTAIRLLAFTGGTVAQSNGAAITLGAGGTALTLSSGGVNLRFTPAANRDTAVTIPYVVVDPSGVNDSSSSNITVNITASADPPSAGGNVTATAPGGGATSIAEDASAPGAANIRVTPTTLSDPDNGQTPTSVRLISVTGGTVTQSGGGGITLGASGTVLALSSGNLDLRFTPTANRDTAATISYVVVDPGGISDSAQSTVTVNITPGADAPTAGGNITATSPGGGAVSITEDAAAPGAANIRVTPTTLIDVDTGETPDAIRLLAFTGGTVAQGDGSAIVLGASGTILSLTGGNLDLRFTPAANRDTAVTIPYVVVDPGGVSDSSASNITISITAVNDAPTAGNATLADIAEDTSNPPGATISALFGGSFSDVEGTFSGIAVVTNPQLGSEGVWQYSPDPGAGSVWFPIGSVSAASSLALDTATRLRFVPTANFGGVVTSISIRVLDNTHGGGFSSRSGGVENRVTFSTSTNGSPTAISGATNTLAHTVTSDNDKPTSAQNNSLTLNQGDAATISSALLSYSDTDDIAANLTYTVVTGPANGTLNLGASFTQAAIDTNSLTYTHDGTATQSDSFTFNVKDDENATTSNATFNIIINLTPTVATPIADVLVNESAPNSVISLLSSFDDAEDGAGGLTYTVASTTGSIFNGTPTIAGSNLTIAYPANTPGTGTITIRATDSGSDFVEDTFQVTVNDRPTAVADSGNTNEGAAVTIDVLLNDSDTDGTLTPASVTVTSAPANGSTSVNATNGRITYTPTGNFNGTNTFQYTVNDNRAATSNAATVTVTVNAVNDGPVLTLPGATQNVDEGSSLVFSTASGNPIGVADVDADETALPTGGVNVSLAATKGTFTLASTAGLVNLTGNSSASVSFDATIANATLALNGLTYTPTALLNGAETLTVTVSDKGNTGAGGVLSDSGTIDVSIASTNNPPVVTVPGGQSVNEDTTTGISGISIADPDAGGGSLTVTLGVAQGRIAVNTAASGGVTAGNITGNNSSSVTLAGTLTQLNNTLPTVTFATATNLVSTQTLTVGANDNGNTGGAAQSDSKTITLTITPQNDNPSFSNFPGAQSVNEDTNLVFNAANANRITVADVDVQENNPGGTVRVSLGVGSGTVTLGATSGLTSVTGNATAAVVLVGPLTNVNNALNGLTYRGSQHYNGPDTLSATLNDLGNTGAGGGSDISQSVSLTVNAVNDPPAITVPATQTADENVNFPFSATDGNAIVIDDPDADEAPGELVASISVLHGTLTLANGAGLLASSGNGTATLNMTGTLAALEAALDGLVYRGDLNFNGSDTLSISVDDQGNSGSGGAATDSATVDITVDAVNNAPQLALPGAQSINEDATASIAGISVSDVDAGGGTLVVSLGVGAGRLQVDGTISGGVQALAIGNNNTNAITLTGTLGELNTTLPSLRFTSALNNRNNQTLSVSANDQGNTGQGGSQIATGTVPLNITALNDDPSLSLPGTQTINEESGLTFGAANSNAVTVSDPDVAETPGQLRVTLSVARGRLSLATTSGISLVSGSGINDTSVTFSGVASALNTAMNGLSYQPDANVNTASGGAESLSITVNDQGFTGNGGGENVTGAVPITILAVNDAPELSVPGARTVNEDTDLVFGGNVSISDVDVDETNDGALEVSLAVTKGLLTLPGTAGLTIDAPATGTGDSAITFRGSLSDVNAALNGMRYRGNADVSGSDTLSLLVSDQGNTGAGGDLNDSASVAITLTPVNDAPVASNATLSPAEPLRNENLSATYNYLDVDGNAESGSLIRWFRNDVIQPAFNNLSEVPGASTVEGEVWYFQVTPGDGIVSGALVQSNSVTIRPVADLQLFIDRDPNVVVPGENVTYTFQVRNLGPSPVDGAEVATVLPAALQNATWTCDACGASGNGAINETVDLASGETVEYVLVAEVDPAATGALNVSGSVLAPALVFETDASSNTRTNSATLAPEASLTVTMTADRDTAQPGDFIAYTVTATNSGPSDARGVFFSDTPDANSTLLPESVTTSLGAIVGSGAGGISINVGTLPLGDSVTIRYTVSVNAPFPAEGREQICTRGLFFGEPDNPEVNFANATPDEDICTAITTEIALSAINTDALRFDANADGVANPGDTIRYTVDLSNLGNGGANNVTYTQPAIANGSLLEDSVTASTPGAVVILEAGALTVNLGGIQGAGSLGSTATITFDVAVVNPLPPGTAFLASQGSLDFEERPDGADPILSDDPAAVVIEGSDIIEVDGDGNIVRPAPTVTPIVAAPALVVRQGDDITRNEEKQPGDTIQYTVTIENRGNLGALNLFYRVPFRDSEISELELGLVDGGDPLSDTAAALLGNFSVLDVDESAGLSSAELSGSLFALTEAQFNALDTGDARVTLDEDSILVNGNARTNEGDGSELLLNLGSLNGRNPVFTNGPTITITFTVEINPVLRAGTNVIRYQGVADGENHAPVVSDDPETINTAADATQTSVRAVPVLAIEPEILTVDFGDQDIDDGPTATRIVEITNIATATANLTLGFVGLEGASLSDFTIVSDTDEATLAPGQTRLIAVAFDPRSIGNKRASLRVESDDPDDGALDVNLSGRALDSDIRVTPGSLDFGKRNLLAGPSNPQSVSIINDGLGDLTLDSVSLACGPDIFPVMTQDRFDELDINGDGALSRGVGLRRELEDAIDLFDLAEEIISRFAALDADSSLDISPEEMDRQFPFLTDPRFEALDGDSSGDLEAAELSAAIRLAGFAESLLNSFDDFDTSLPEGLDFTEAQSILPDLTELEFLDLDGDGDGVLSRIELEERLKLALLATQLQVDFTGLDATRDEALTAGEIEVFVPLLTPGRFAAIDEDGDEELSRQELGNVESVLAVSLLSQFSTLDTDASGGLTAEEINATCAFEMLSDSGEDILETAQSRLVRIVFDPSTEGAKVGTLRVEANQQGQGTPIVSKVSLFGTGNRTPRITGQNPVATNEDTPVTIILDNLIVDAPLLDFPDEVTLSFQPLPADANYTRDGNSIIPNRNFNGVLFVPVTVRDGNIDSNVWNLRIDVARENDPPTSITLDGNTILENQVLDTVIGRFSTADPDLGDLHLYSLVPDDPSTDDDDFVDNEFFGIVANQLVSRVVFDFETRSEYTVLVRSRDPQGQTFERAFGVTILDQPDDEDNAVAAEVLLDNFENIDANRDGILDLDEALVLLPGFTPERFDSLNLEVEISLAEIQGGIGFTAAAQTLFDNFDLADGDGDGLLTLAEARTRVPGLTEAAYDYMDLEPAMALSPSELQTAILLLGDLDYLRENFESLDEDDSGSLTLDELPDSLSALTTATFEALDLNPGLSRRELESQVVCVVREDGVRLIQPTGDLLAPPGESVLDVTFNAEADVNIQGACNADDIEFSFDIGAESILITDLAEYFLQNFDALDADFNGTLGESEVASSRIGLTSARFTTLDFDGNGQLSTEELEAAVILSDIASALLADFAVLNTDNSTGLSVAETLATALDIDQLRYDLLDLNGNGVLTRDELEAEEDLPGFLLENFQSLDSDSSVTLDLAELRDLLPGLSQVRFDNLDVDRSGDITPEELQNADDFGRASAPSIRKMESSEFSKQIRGNAPAVFTLPVDTAYRVRVTATLVSTGQSVQSDDVTFEIRNGTDADDNGYLDFPFEELFNDGARWERTVTSVGCDRSVLLHAWRGANIPGRDIEATLVNPANAQQRVNITVPHGLAEDGEEAILIAAIACGPEALFTRQQAEGIEDLPEDAVSGTPWIAVEVIVRDIGAPEFAPVSVARLAARPVSLLLNRLDFSPEDQATFFVNGVSVLSDDTSGLTVVPGGGSWSSADTEGALSESGTLSASVSRLGTVVALESLKPPIFASSPAIDETIDLGEVRVNESVERRITITNEGGERLIGTAELRDATGVFALIGEASYKLGHGETHQFLVRFSPRDDTAYAAAITFSGDPGGLLTAAISGTGMPAKGLGCGPVDSAGTWPWGNAVVVALTLGGLLLGQRRSSKRAG
ncbi:MAG: tandem-95 repeat protein [Candidatus Hydrogenedentes bacterium]|nr:tandem-95 repeat protein [Candidatus Hydrogenedentota bacterium]